MSEEELQTIEARLGAATPGPWQWAHLYQARGTHWCLENEASAALGLTINHHLVTFGTEEYEYDDDGQATRLDQTPDFQLIAHAPGDIAALLAEVRRLRAALEEIDRTTVGAYESGFGDLELCEQCGEMRTIAENALRSNAT